MGEADRQRTGSAAGLPRIGEPKHFTLPSNHRCWSQALILSYGASPPGRLQLPSQHRNGILSLYTRLAEEPSRPILRSDGQSSGHRQPVNADRAAEPGCERMQPADSGGDGHLFGRSALPVLPYCDL
eukprot:scaffold667184_cov42-Prasinocladus_malaysianus.AAC.2